MFATLILGVLIGACGTIVAQNVVIQIPEQTASIVGGALIMFAILILIYVAMKGRVFPHDWGNRS